LTHIPSLATVRYTFALVLLSGCLASACMAQQVVGTAPAAPLLEQLSLLQAEKYLQDRNRELQMARRAIESSDAAVASAQARPNPALSAGVSQVGPNSGVGPGNAWNKHADTVVGVSQLFERGNKRELRMSVAEANAAASRNDRDEVERQQRVALQGAYYDLKLSQERLAIAGETAASYRRLVDAARLRLKTGDIAATDLARINVDALRAENDNRAAGAEVLRAQLALAYLIGADADAARIRAVDPWPEVEEARQPGDIERLLAQRADVRAAQARVDAAERGRQAALALRTRDVTGGIQYERFPGDGANNTYGVFVSIPLFTGYYYEGEVRKAESDLGAARDGLDRARALAQAEIIRTRSDVDAAGDRLRRSRSEVLAAAEKAADGAEFAYGRGAIGVMDLLDARRQLYAARLEVAATQADYSKALAAWRAASTVPEHTSNRL
jgi:cobalt-zinc-cadmium efflux system outer membrane protein